jgi:hypothetical protein
MKALKAFKRLFRNRYRITQCAKSRLYEAQYRPWFWPWWFYCNWYNCSLTIEEARDVCDRHAISNVVEHYEP